MWSVIISSFSANFWYYQTMKNIYYGIIPISLLILVLTVILTKDYQNENKTIISQNTNKEQIISDNVVNNQVLTVLPDRCRGCGKCAIIDPAHFQMSGRVATVISQNNLNSDSLLMAISNCRDRAISLN